MSKERVKTVLVVVPHEDDEINVAGTTIYRSRQAGERVICVFVTNGDWLYPAKVRMKEAIASLKELGVPSEDVLFLGYPDGGVYAEKSLFMHGRKECMTIDGRTHTYGTDLKRDFSSLEYGHPQPYKWDCLLEDLMNVILKYKPNTIIGTDFDNHPDHRMCSIALDLVMGEILNSNGNDYFPLYLKGFAYSVAFEGKNDFFSNHLLSARINGKALSYSEYGVDNPTFSWEKRIRIPVSKVCRAMTLKNNVIYRALSSYISQRIFVRVGRIVNGDQIFWQRRTDNLAHQGKMTVSSGNSAFLHDFLTMYTDDISAKKPCFNNYYWRPDDEDKEPWCRCTFSKPRHIEQVSLWGIIENCDQEVSGELIFSNGYRSQVKSIKGLGRETEISIEPQDQISWIEFRILGEMGVGIAEWGIYERKDCSLPMIHILCNGEFAYDWSIWPGEKIPQITAYAHHIYRPLRWILNGNTVSSLEELQAQCNQIKMSALIRVEVEGQPELYHEIQITRRTFADLFLFRAHQLRECFRIHWMRLCREPRHHAMKREAKRLKK